MSADPQLSPDYAGAILVIRRDNIGDLVCTTPLLRALRQQLPAARIAVLANRYNEAVLRGNPDVDVVYSYTKAKHRAEGEFLLGAYLDRLRTIAAMRRERFDYVLLPGGPQASALRFSRWVGGRTVLIRSETDAPPGLHEVQQACGLLSGMGLRYEEPPLRLAAGPAELAWMDRHLESALRQRPSRLIGLHISARKPSQRWPAERFVELARTLRERDDVGLVLLWAPGSTDNVMHPGDDAKAAEILAALRDVPIVPVATQNLEQLIAAIARCDAFVCSDGGAMHLAAGLGKPIVAFFGQSPADRWHPWRVPHIVLQKESRDVGDISVAEALSALERLVGPPPLVRLVPVGSGADINQ